ncbi:MAG: glycosyltransferase family 2 protein [Firmicutes bacterium]|nr:glycosyltransferase family 2 protein [Bacillota bacterium]
MERKIPSLYIVIPCYNEEQVLPMTAPMFLEELTDLIGKGKITDDSRILFVNDGSKDKTEEIINELEKNDEYVRAVSFTRNFGKESALCAGLDYATGDAVIPMDVDLQDPVEIIPALIEKWQSGADVVLAKRADRSSDSFLKRNTAKWFYKLHNSISNPHIEEDVGDFRLMSREVVDNIKRLQERNVFMKGLLSWVGGRRIEIVEYVRPERSAGTTKFNGWKLWNLALEGITSFSTVPLRVWSYLGGLIAGCAFLYGLWKIIEKLIWGNNVPGYSSLIVAILFLGGVQLIGIGILGEYIGRIYIETKARPRYVVKKR